MGNRKQPFGYHIRFGEIEAAPAEADAVRWIFEQYAEGTSYAKLVSALAERGVLYDEGKLWNKNMIARILADERYIGTDVYPAILDADLFHRAAERRPDCGTLAEENRDVKLLRPLVRCVTCGVRIKREANNAGWERWVCPSCGILSEKATTPHLSAAVTALLNELIQNPGQLSIPESSPDPRTSNRLRAELEDELKTGIEHFDGATAKTLAFSLAAAQFEELGSGAYETRRLRRLFQNRTPADVLDAAPLRETVSAILVGTDSRISLKLKNGQIIGREYQT